VVLGKLNLVVILLAAVVCLTAQDRREIPQDLGQGWNGFARDAKHTALSTAASQPLSRIQWRTPVDLSPQYSGGELLIHYGSPLVTAANTVIVPVKTGPTGGFRVEARAASDGALQWSMPTDYILPPSGWTPEFGPVLTASRRVYFPGAGGTVYYRDDPDAAAGATGQIAFYGLENYQADPVAYDSHVMICTPITADPSGNIYFGFQVLGPTAVPLRSGLARIDAAGAGTWVSAVAASGDPSMLEVAHNCAPALNWDLRTLYVAVSDTSAGYLVALDSTTLAPLAAVRLKDPASGKDAWISDNASASPTVGPDGDVYYGVLESAPGANHLRGWLLHFNGLLTTSGIPAAFGWDDTSAVVRSVMVPSYTGPSAYLLMTKYNNYIEAGGDGLNELAILDPNDTELDPVTGATVMREVLTILGPTSAGPEGGVKEWCINSAAVDPGTKSVLAGSEDGKLYRWDLESNSLSEQIVLTPGLGEAYTPTVIGPDGTVYAINNATLFAVGK
jgi:hypothetical protein